MTAKPPKIVKDPRLLAMREKLRTEAGRALYALRKQTVEPVFGIIKGVTGFRQFLIRGLAKVSAKWDLVCLAYNVKRLWALNSAWSGRRESRAPTDLANGRAKPSHLTQKADSTAPR